MYVSTQFFTCWSQSVSRETSERETSDGETSYPAAKYIVCLIYTTGERREEKRERDSWLAIKISYSLSRVRYEALRWL